MSSVKNKIRLVYYTLSTCNLSCVGCNTFSNHTIMQHVKPKKSVDTFKEDLEVMLDRIDLISFAFTGGETLMRPDIWEMVSYVCDRLSSETSIEFYTNGLLLDDYHISKILHFSKTYSNIKFVISYHHSPEHNNKYNNIMIEGIKKLFLNLHSNKEAAEQIRNALINTSHNGWIDDNNVRHDAFPLEKNIAIDFKPLNQWKFSERQHDSLPVQYNNDYKEAHKACKCPVPFYNTNGEIFKCPYMYTLKKLLELHNKLDEWPLLRDYKPYSLYEDHDYDRLEKLKGPEEICSYCPVEYLTNKEDHQTKLIKLLDVS